MNRHALAARAAAGWRPPEPATDTTTEGATMVKSTESASTPISAGGWRYDPGNEQDRSDFAGYTAEELRNLAREDDRGYDFSQHPATPELDQEDRPVYAWTVEGYIHTGSLVKWCRDYEEGHYSGMSVPMEVIRLHVGDHGIETVHTRVDVRSTGQADDYLYYRAMVQSLVPGSEPGSLQVTVDTADLRIDGRA